ncbi:hypothetical protein BSY19_5100 (plasmid) [Bosea sp. RAC05]|nr:hypothetical protein BSY19_5100 [Bosea sp. RAC05]
MQRHLKRLKKLLAAACESVSIQGEIQWDAASSTFGIPGSGVEIAVETRDSGFGWRVREIYEVPDLRDGGHRPVEDVIARLMPGDEVEATRLAVLRAVSRRLDIALDAAA